MRKILIALSLFLATGCVSMSTLQTARTLDQGETRQTFGGGTFKTSDNIQGVKTETNIPYVEYSIRYGMIERLDLGLRLTLIGSYVGDAKYELYSNDKFAAAIGAGIGYMSYQITSGATESKVNNLDFIIPFYLSYDFAKNFSVYLAPKYIHRTVSGDSSGSDSIVGGSVGTKIGEKSGVFLEVSSMKGKDSDQITQYNISYFW